MNFYVIRKYSGYFVLALAPLFGWVFGQIIFGLIGAMVGMFIGMGVGLFIANNLTNHPLRAIVEGQGLLFLRMSSTGSIQPFVMNINAQDISGFIRDKFVVDTWDGNSRMYFNKPIECKKSTMKQDEHGNWNLTLTKEEYQLSRFQMETFPCFIYNDQVESTLTKDWFSDKEHNTVAHHQIIHLNRNVEKLGTAITNFGRATVDLALNKPPLITAQGLMWIAIVLGAGAFIWFFGGDIMAAFGGVTNSVGDTLTPVAQGAVNTITPIP